MADKVVKVTTHMASGWKLTAQVREHLLVIDQPSVTNEGANPLETFLFSLGACISAIARIVALERHIESRQFDVNVHALMNSAGLLGQPSEDPVGFKEITINASMDADLSEAQKREFLDIVCNRCPVHDNLLRPTLVTHAVRD